jgi:hypothetical protein
MLSQWSDLSNDLQLTLAREAMRRAVQAIAAQADILAEEMEAGHLQDRGGPEALRLFAAVIRATGNDDLAVEGRA